MIDVRYKPGQRVVHDNDSSIAGIVLSPTDPLVNPIHVPIHAIITHIESFIIIKDNRGSVNYYHSNGNAFRIINRKVRLPMWL